VDVVFYLEIGGGGDVDRGTNSVPSFGEREHALSFARQIQQAGYRPRFVVGPLIARHIQAAGFEPEVFWSPDVGLQIVKGIDPALVIACELFNVSPESAAGLIETCPTLASMDGTSLPIEINTDPFEKPEISRSLVLPDHYYSFRPSPVNDLGTDSENVFYWPLFPRLERPARDERVYASLGLDPSRRIVMFAAAPWAQGAAAMLDLDNEDYYRNLANRIVAGLEASGEAVDFFFLSMFPMSSMPTEAGDRVAIHYSGLIPYEAYDHLLKTCDLIVSDNIIQTSVSKAVVMGTPHLIIQDTLGSELPYRFNMFPLKLMFPSERDYARIVEVAEYSDADGIGERIVALLAQGYWDAERHERRREYVGGLDRLSSPAELLERIIGASA